jgi:hypothetical protein
MKELQLRSNRADRFSDYDGGDLCSRAFGEEFNLEFKRHLERPPSDRDYEITGC